VIVAPHSGETEIAIIGAGAAGLGAAEVLAVSRESFLLLEAKSRIGGRAWSVTPQGLSGYLLSDHFPLDMGCGWLHSADRNPWTGIAKDLGFTIDRTPPSWERQSCNQGLSAEDQKEFRRASRELKQRLADVRLAPETDRAAATFLEPNNPWNPLLSGVSTFMNAAPLEELSTCDVAAYQDTEVNWRVAEGYGTVVSAFASGINNLPLALNTPVDVVRHGARGIKLETPKGTITARKVIVTVPSPVIASGAIRFDPGLPEKSEAADNLPTGLVNKAFFHCDEIFPKDGHFFGNVRRTDTGSYHLRPFGRPMIECFFAGHLACELAKEGPEATFYYATAELAGLIGTGVRQRLRPILASSWHDDEYIRGAYSHAKVGHSTARQILARSINDRLFFAGEATSPDAFSTAHGAYLSGGRAAREALSGNGHDAGRPVT
jgi:monoamine oxidase